MMHSATLIMCWNGSWCLSWSLFFVWAQVWSKYVCSWQGKVETISAFHDNLSQAKSSGKILKEIQIVYAEEIQNQQSNLCIV